MAPSILFRNFRAGLKQIEMRSLNEDQNALLADEEEGSTNDESEYPEDQRIQTRQKVPHNWKIYLAVSMFSVLFTIVFQHLFFPKFEGNKHTGNGKETTTSDGDATSANNDIAGYRFTSIAENADIDYHLDSRPLELLCSQTKWREGLIFAHRDSTGGGGGNVRNAFLNGVRFAIEAGASYVIPRIEIRDSNDLSQLSSGIIRDFSYLYDRTYFKSVLGKACPKMKIYDDFDDISNEDWAKDPLKLTPNQLDEGTVQGFYISHPELWKSRFETWLGSEKAIFSAERPLLVVLQSTFLQWPIHADSPALVHSFGRMIRSSERVRYLAARVLSNLNIKYNLSMDPHEGIRDNTYFGAHLRTAADAANAHWTGYDQQAAHYLDVAEQAQLSLIYVATGDPKHLKQFKQDAAERFLTVETKTTLLHGKDLEDLQELSWDQQGLVDYEMMLKASRFSGIEQSSFAYSVAVRRHATLMTRDPHARWTPEQLDPKLAPWWSRETAETRENTNPNDELSEILGDANSLLFAITLWP